MAILDRGILGGGRNAVGTVVMTKWRGKDVIRARVTPSNPQTAAQTEQRDLFALLTRAGSTLIDAFVRPYWRRYERSCRNATTAFNEFVRANVRVMRGAGVAGQPPGTFDSAQLLLTRGPLEPADPTGLADDAGQVQVMWEPASGPAGDAVAVVATTLDGALALVETGAVRGDGSLTVPVGYGERGLYAFHVVAYRPGATALAGAPDVARRWELNRSETGAGTEPGTRDDRPMDTQNTDRDGAAGWLVRNALHLAVGLLVALFGWTTTHTLDGVAEDVAATSVRIERLDEALRGVLVDQASQARRIEHAAAETARLERRLEHIESRLETR